MYILGLSLFFPPYRLLLAANPLDQVFVSTALDQITVRQGLRLDTAGGEQCLGVVGFVETKIIMYPFMRQYTST